MNQDSSRRQFLTGKFRGKDSSQPDPSNGQTAQPLSDESVRAEHYLEHFTRPAMACDFEWLFNMQQYPHSGSVALSAFELLDQLEAQLTVYRPSSEISAINREAANGWIQVETELFQLLQRGLQISAETGGAFDMTAGPLSKTWGFHKREGRLPTQAEIEQTLQHVGYRNIELNPGDSSIRFQRSQTTINLGGIGKGFALDKIGQLLRDNGIEDFVLHGGQSSVLAGGSELHPEGNGPPGWTVGLTHPFVPGRRLAEIYLQNQALATSGTARQGFIHAGKRYGHIIDPRTGWPTDHCWSSTVICQSAELCDALATAFFVMSPDHVARYCETQTSVSAILVLPAKSTSGYQIQTFNLHDSQWSRLDKPTSSGPSTPDHLVN